MLLSFTHLNAHEQVYNQIFKEVHNSHVHNIPASLHEDRLHGSRSKSSVILSIIIWIKCLTLPDRKHIIPVAFAPLNLKLICLKCRLSILSWKVKSFLFTPTHRWIPGWKSSRLEVLRIQPHRRDRHDSLGVNSLFWKAFSFVFQPRETDEIGNHEEGRGHEDSTRFERERLDY